MDVTRPMQHALALIDPWLAYAAYADPRIPGLSVGIICGGEIVFARGYGYADSARLLHATEATCYRIASISKIFTTIAILQLVEQDRLRLDAPVSAYLPWFTSPTDEHLRAITLRHLLTHTSGIERDGTTSHWIDFQFPARDVIHRHLTEGATVYAPLEEWKYSNIGFTVLGAVVEQAAGMPYATYVTRHIIAPLDLRHTAPEVTEAVRDRLAVGYASPLAHQPQSPFPLIDTGSMAPATGFVSSVVDLCHFMRAQFAGDERLLSAQMQREMRRVQWRRPGAADWCLGLECWAINGRPIYGHTGSFPGYKARFGMDVERKIGVVALANGIAAPARELVNGILECIDFWVTHNHEVMAQAAASPAIDHSEAYIGMYTNIWEDAAVAAIARQLILFPLSLASPIAELYHLVPERDNRFRLRMSAGNTFGPIGEVVRFEQEGERMGRMVIGANPLTRFALP